MHFARQFLELHFVRRPVVFMGQSQELFEMVLFARQTFGWFFGKPVYLVRDVIRFSQKKNCDRIII